MHLMKRGGTQAGQYFTKMSYGVIGGIIMCYPIERVGGGNAIYKTS